MKLKHLLGVAVLASSGSAMAGDTPDPTIPQDYVQTGRYSHVVNEPYLSQKNPLKVVVNTRIPTTVENVEQALNFLLMRSGYALADYSVLSPEAKILLGHELPQIHRHLGPMTLDNALQTLAGEAYELVVDPINRKVAFVTSRDLVGG